MNQIFESKGTPDFVKDFITTNNNLIVKSIKSNIDLFIKIDRDDISCSLTIKFNTEERYNGNINYKNCLDSNFDKCIINIFYPEIYDTSMIIKSLGHELTHLYELYQIKDKYDKTKWKWQDAITNTKEQDNSDSKIKYFRDIFYLSLPQEINARVSSLYGYLYMNKSNNLDDCLRNSIEWINYINMINFSYDLLYTDLVRIFEDKKSLLYFMFNDFNENLGINKKIENDADLVRYLKRFDDRLKVLANKFKNKMIRVLKRVKDENNISERNYLTFDPGDVNYNNYKEDVSKKRNELLETILSYNSFLKTMNI